MAGPLKKFTILNVVVIASLAALICYVPAEAQQDENSQGHGLQSKQKISPARGINHPPLRAMQSQQNGLYTDDEKYRTIDGSNNNLQQTSMGTPYTHLIRLLAADYGDSLSTLAGAQRASARLISNHVFSQTESMPNPLKASDYLWQWGQFIDHDIVLTDGTDPVESANIKVPEGDAFFDPASTGVQEIYFNRSIYDTATGADKARQQVNEITSWIDASNVYGSNQARANALRTYAGDGKLKSSDGNLLPFNTDVFPNAGGGSTRLFLAGDVRANEQTGLTVLHTLFMREHNRLAELIADENPRWNGDEIYQKARQLVGAELQHITYEEYLPALLGPGALTAYHGYNPAVDASIANIFSTAAYRFGHSALNSTLLRIDESGQETVHGHLPLRNAFFNPSRIIDEGGIEPVLRGLAMQEAQAVDARVIDDVRNFLFGQPGAGGFDLASLNIQRGRDHGLPSYNDVRESLGFTRATDFTDINTDPDTQARLSGAYQTVNDIDLWVGGLSEDPVSGSHLGPLFHKITKDQFEALRDGDRYWYARTLSRKERNMVEQLRLSDIIRLNTEIDREIQNNVFKIAPSGKLKPRPEKGL